MYSLTSRYSVLLPALGFVFQIQHGAVLGGATMVAMRECGAPCFGPPGFGFFFGLGSSFLGPFPDFGFSTLEKVFDSEFHDSCFCGSLMGMSIFSSTQVLFMSSL